MLTLVKAGYRNIPKTQIRIDSLLKTRFIAAVSGKALTSPTMITRALSGPDLEQSVGIEVYSTDTSGFLGVIKQRYSDFIVREIDIYNRIARLEKTDGMAVEKAAFAVAQSDSADSVEAVDAYLTDLTTLGIAFDDTACREFLLECVRRETLKNARAHALGFRQSISWLLSYLLNVFQFRL